MTEKSDEILEKEIQRLESDVEHYYTEIGKLFVKVFDVDFDLISKPSDLLPVWEDFRENMPGLIKGLRKAEAQVKSLLEVQGKILVHKDSIKE